MPDSNQQDLNPLNSDASGLALTRVDKVRRELGSRQGDRGKKREINSGKKYPVDAELLRLVTTTNSELETRKRFRGIALVAATAVGACHLTPQGNEWDLDPQHRTGRLPAMDDLEDSFFESCWQACNSHSIQVVKLKSLDGMTGLLVPVRPPVGPSEILLLVLRKKAPIQQASQVGIKVSAAMHIWLKGNHAEATHWQANALASIMELVTKVEKCRTTREATDEVANELARQLKCNHVAIAIREKKRLRLKTVSGVHKLDRTSKTSLAYLQAMMESAVRNEQGVFPTDDQDNNHLLLAHKQLASQIRCEAVLSEPLSVGEKHELGVWLLAGAKEHVASKHTSRFVKAATPHIAASLDLVKRNQRGRFSRCLRFLHKKVSWGTKLCVPAIIIGLCWLMMLPVTYKVRCNCKVEPVSRRFAVAPFDGIIVSGHAKPGDLVEQGEVLAEIDGRTIRWELSGVTAERRQSLRQREIELAEGNIPETFLSELENERLTSQEKILQFKKEHLLIRSPISGVVLSGSLERAEASSVTTGEVLFEVGPTESMKVEIAIPSEDILQVKPGHPVTIWIEGQEDQPLKSKVRRIHPRSEIRDAKNIYVAELEFDNSDDRLRPGMSGTVRIDCDKRTLGWSLFHKPMNYLRARLTWW